jgi:hypothetical protein
MKKIIIAAFTIILYAACNSGSNTGSNSDTTSNSAAVSIDTASAPVISFENMSHDFGKVKAGEKVSYQYKFTNTGKSPLIISNAIASCGCTVPDYPRTPVNPGGEGTISVVFDSAGKSGVQDKVITLTSNANPTTTLLHLTGEVN